MRIFSGIQPTGRKHLGNYIGAIRQYVDGQDRGDPAIYCIVDLHALTVPWDPAALRESVYDTTAILLAAGLDPERCILFRQSDVHAYKGQEVPVGDDQRQHVELMREIARRFNERFGPVLEVPDWRIPEVGARIMDLQEPASKMSTTGGTEAGTVLVLDDAKTVTKKIKSAVTDSGSEVKRGDGKEGIANLIQILAVVRGTSEEEIEREFDGSGYGDFKGAVAEAVVDFLAPVRERYEALRGDEQALESALSAGAEKAREIAAG